MANHIGASVILFSSVMLGAGSMPFVGTFPNDDGVEHFAVCDSAVVAADAEGAIFVLDPTTLELRSQLVVDGRPEAIGIVGDVAYLTYRIEGPGPLGLTIAVDRQLRTIDLSDPSAAEFGGPGIPMSARVDWIGGDQGVLALNTPNVLVTVSLADPLIPTFVGSTPTEPSPVFVHGGLAHTASGVFDITNPASPAPLPDSALVSEPVATSPPEYAFDYPWAYTANIGARITTWDVTLPDHPLAIEQIHFRGDVLGVAADQGPAHVLLASDMPGLMYIRTLPETPSPDDLGIVRAGMRADRAFATGLRARGTRAYLSGTDIGLLTLDPPAPLPIDPHIEGVVPGTENGALGLCLVGTRLYTNVVGPTGGLVVHDVTDPARPVELGRLNSGGGVNVQVIDDLAYVARSSVRFAIVDVSDPASMSILYESPFDPTYSSHTLQVRRAGSHLYMLDDRQSLVRVFDLADITNPVEVASVPVPEPYGMDIENNTLYVASNVPGGGEDGVVIFDITNPASPQPVGEYLGPLPGINSEIQVRDGLAYVAGGMGLYILDVTDPSSPELVGGVPTFAPGSSSATPRGIALHGSTVILADQVTGTHFIDVSAPHTPVPVGFFPSDRTNVEVAIGDGVAFVATDDGVLVLRLSTPPCPADLDGNGTLNFDDIDAFITAFLASDLLADLDGNGTLNFDDLDAFVASFLAGCP